MSREGDEEPKIGDQLGEWSSELEPDEYIVDFVALASKVYSYETNTGRKEIRCKGMTLNEYTENILEWDEIQKQYFKSGKIMNKEMFEALLTGVQDTQTVVYPDSIKRDGRSQRLSSVTVTKTLQKVYDKRIMLPDYTSMPYGTKNNIIYFYSPHDKFGFLSNFYPSTFTVNFKQYASAEHYYQSKKATNAEEQERIRNCPSPHEAWRLGRKTDLCTNWEKSKYQVMKVAVGSKFIQNNSLRRQLFDTHGKHLVENSKNDAYWGLGPEGTGLNQLGHLLEELRDDMNRLPAVLSDEEAFSWSKWTSF